VTEGLALRDDVQRLVDLAHDATADGREALYHSVADLYEELGDELTLAERQIMDEIMHALTRGVEMSVRLALAERLKEKATAPRALILMLANDAIDVAFPVLQRSALLSAHDLIDVVKLRTRQHQLAVAAREYIGESVSEVLADTADAEIVTTLLKNQSARISAPVMVDLVETSRAAGALQEPLLARQDLPSALAARMYSWVADALQNFILVNFPVSERDIAEAVDATREQLIAAAIQTGRARSPTEQIIDKLHDKGELKPEFLTNALRRGEVALFELAFARLCGVPLLVMHRVLYDEGAEGLALACRAIGVGRETFRMMFEMTRRSRGRGMVIDPAIAAKAFDLFDKTLPARAAVQLRARYGGPLKAATLQRPPLN